MVLGLSVIYGGKIEWSCLSPGQRKRSSILQRSYKRELSNYNKLCFVFIAYWKDKESLDKKTTDLLAEKVSFLLEIKPLTFNQFMKMYASMSIIITMQILDFVPSLIAGLPVTWRGHVIGGQEQKHFSPMGTKLYFSRKFFKKNSIVLIPNTAALSVVASQ